jgi:hypothetical protein
LADEPVVATVCPNPSKVIVPETDSFAAVTVLSDPIPS